MLVDSHCHLDFPDFDGERDEIVARARAAGVSPMVTICTHVSKFAQVLDIALGYDDIYCTVGIHPHNAGSEEPVEQARLEKLGAHPKVIGLGETGLDYYYDHSPREDQRRSFRTHIAASRQSGLPVIVHTRDAEEDTLAILAEEMEQGAFPGLIHCFSASDAFARRAVDMGFYISMSGIVTFKGAAALRETVKNLPPERILVETDAPYLAPAPKRGKRNEPSFTVHTARVVAAQMGLEFDDFARLSTANFHRLFPKVARSPNS